MPTKIKDFLKSVAETGGIKDADFDAVLAASALNDIDLPDTFVNKFHNEFLTKDRAKNDPTIVSEIVKSTNKTAFNTFDEKASGFLSMLDPEDQEKVKGTKETYEKYDIIKAGLKKVIAAKTTGKGAEDVRKIEEEWAGKLKTAEDTYKSELKKFKEDYDSMIVDNMVKGKVMGYNFASQFAGLKEAIADVTVNKLKSKYKLALDKGSIAVMNDVDGILREAYEGPNKVTLETYLENELKQFIAVSNGGKGGDSHKEKGTPPSPIDRSKATLAELRQMQVAGVIQ